MKYLAKTTFDCGHRDSEGSFIVYQAGQEFKGSAQEVKDFLVAGLIEQVSASKKSEAKKVIESKED